MLDLAVLADDLTGGAMAASLIESAGLVCPVATSIEALAEIAPQARAVVLARKIRLVEPDLARAEAQAAVAAFQALGARRIYSKYSAVFDSTERGNIGPIAEALMAALDAPRTLFCPAWVEADLTVYQGHLFVGPTPLAESFKRRDPVTPATDSNIVRVLQAQTRVKVGLLPRRALAAGPEAARAALERQADARFFIADAIEPADIERLAALALDWPLVTGGDSLAPGLARAILAGGPRQAGSGRRLLGPAGGRAAVLAGSCAPATLAQLQAFETAHPVRRVDLAGEGDDPVLARRILDWAAPRLGDGPIAVATSADRAGVEAAQARFGREGAAARADRLLADVAAGLKALGVRRFVVAGGETSGEVLAALGAHCLEVSGFDEMSGGYCRQDGADPIALVIKAGGVGGGDFLELALARLDEADCAGETGGREAGERR
jgi:uncharacterized protein YgbK (DUF1537 family)